MRLLGRAEAGERYDFARADRRDRRHAGADCLPVKMHRAGAALGKSAAEMRVVEPDIVAQRIEQRHVRIGLDSVILAVHAEGEFIDHDVSFQPWAYPPNWARKVRGNADAPRSGTGPGQRLI